MQVTVEVYENGAWRVLNRRSIKGANETEIAAIFQEMSRIKVGWENHYIGSPVRLHVGN